MDLDLARALRDLSDEPTVPAEVIPLAAVLARVRRTRALRTAGVGVASAAAVVALAVAVQAAPFNDGPVTPADPTPSVEPTPSPTAVPSPDPTEPVPAVTDEPVTPATQAFGLVDGEIVRADLATGGTTTVTTGLGTVGLDLAVDTSGTFAYVSREPAIGPPQEVVQVRLSDGAVEPLGPGWKPSVSPDGSTLAYVAILDAPDEYGNTQQLALVDLETRERTFVPFEPCGITCQWKGHHQGWTADGRLVLTGAVTGELGDMEVVWNTVALVDPASPVAPIRAVDEPVGPVDREEGGLLLHSEIRGLTVGRDGRLVAVVEETAYVMESGTPTSGYGPHRRFLVGVLEDGRLADPVDLTDDVTPLMSESGWLGGLSVDEAPDGSYLVSAALGEYEAGISTSPVWRVTDRVVERLPVDIGSAVM